MESLFTNAAQLGVAFSLLVGIVFVLAKRVLTLEKKIENLTDEKFEIYKEVLEISNESTNTMKSVIKILGDEHI